MVMHILLATKLVITKHCKSHLASYPSEVVKLIKTNCMFEKLLALRFDEYMVWETAWKPCGCVMQVKTSKLWSCKINGDLCADWCLSCLIMWSYFYCFGRHCLFVSFTSKLYKCNDKTSVYCGTQCCLHGCISIALCLKIDPTWFVALQTLPLMSI